MSEINVVDNYKLVEERVRTACERAGRDRSEVTLIAVSKTKPDEMVESLYEYGVRDFGENKPQELLRKHDGIHTGEINWHMIGNLQTNKVKMVVGKACLIHSVQSLHLAEAISKQAEKFVSQMADGNSDFFADDFSVPILIEVNIADEETKQGTSCEFAEVEELVKSCASLPFIKVMGLMAIAPPVESPEENRPYFQKLREYRDSLRAEQIVDAPMSELSMGMTGDFEVAIEEGATLVRVGTAIFGERDYSH